MACGAASISTLLEAECLRNDDEYVTRRDNSAMLVWASHMQLKLSLGYDLAIVGNI